ncbi:hypothetical protein [Streptomyces sp. NPDC005209]|uniref:hypothetical protein n=1 Tax=Streptomyces sp. NPDC005209 TaxID=3156715 RepID=UPI0033B6C2C1
MFSGSGGAEDAGALPTVGRRGSLVVSVPGLREQLGHHVVGAVLSLAGEVVQHGVAVEDLGSVPFQQLRVGAAAGAGDAGTDRAAGPDDLRVVR